MERDLVAPVKRDLILKGVAADHAVNGCVGALF
jgi:hypothetical protein